MDEASHEKKKIDFGRDDLVQYGFGASCPVTV